MPSTRQLALAGSLLRAVNLIRRGWMDSAILERLDRDYPGGTAAQYREIINLAHLGVNAMDMIDFNNPDFVIKISDMPRLPPE